MLCQVFISEFQEIYSIIQYNIRSATNNIPIYYRINTIGNCIKSYGLTLYLEFKSHDNIQSMVSLHSNF